MKFQIFFLIYLLTSCSMIWTDRTFVNEMDNMDETFFVPNQDFPVVPGDSGNAFRNRSEILKRTPQSQSERTSSTYDEALNDELMHLESRVSGEKKYLYDRYREQIGSTSERIYFLRLQSIQDRDNYLISRGIKLDDRVIDPAINEAVQYREVTVGMTKSDVMRSWGSPMRVDVAGNPRYENERWTFYERGTVKQVFFEAGRVQGWSIR